MKPAETITELYQTVNPDESLAPGDPRFTDLSALRGEEDLVALITRRIVTATSPNFHRRLVTGHRGSGKSTELRRVQNRMESTNFIVAYLDVEKTLDLADLEYLDVLIAIASQIHDSAVKSGLKIDDRLLKDVGDWFSETVVTQE